MMSKILLGLKSFFNSLSSHIKSDGIPSAVKLDDVNNTDINPYITLCCCNSCGEILKKPIDIILFELFGSMFKWEKRGRITMSRMQNKYFKSRH